MIRRNPVLYSLLVLAALFFWVARPSFFPDKKGILVRIEKGSGLREIARTLGEKGAVHSPAFFIFLAEISGGSRSFRHGTYLLEKDHYWNSLKKLREGLTHRIKVTIPEGWTCYQVSLRLKEMGLIGDEKAFQMAVENSRSEGMLFPETYFFELESNPEEILRVMVGQFRRNFPEEWRKRAGELKMTERDAVTLASIIEREAKADSERAVISSVYHNRLKKKWFLESCPTVQYALGGGRTWKEKLTYPDLKVKSPYNTYIHRGLPPGPICSPGKKSLVAALYPAQTNYLFFFADGQGKHYFSSSYREHMRKQAEEKRKFK